MILRPEPEAPGAWGALEDRKVLRKSDGTPGTAGRCGGWNSPLGGDVASFAPVTVHMALDLAMPRRVLVLETDSHPCEMMSV